jgi:hypothetical protein
MNLFNRAILIVLCLALLAGAVAVIVVAWAIPDDSINWLRDAVVWLDDHNSDGTKALITVGGAIVGLAAFVAVLAELLPSGSGEVKVTGLQIGDAVLTTAAIGQRIEEAVNQVPHVSDVRATVRARRKGVTVNLDLHVDPEANLAAVTDEACAAATIVLSDKVHVALLAPPRARLHYRELRLQGRARRSTIAPVPPAPPTPAQPPEPEAEVEPPTAAADQALVAEEQPAEAAEAEEKPVQA